MSQSEKWNVFEKTGKISDYLDYCGYSQYGKQEKENENDKWNCNKTTQCRG